MRLLISRSHQGELRRRSGAVAGMLGRHRHAHASQSSVSPESHVCVELREESDDRARGSCHAEDERVEDLSREDKSTHIHTYNTLL